MVLAPSFDEFTFALPEHLLPKNYLSVDGRIEVSLVIEFGSGGAGGSSLVLQGRLGLPG